LVDHFNEKKQRNGPGHVCFRPRLWLCQAAAEAKKAAAAAKASRLVYTYFDHRKSIDKPT
jgi:hypothetical protein